MHVAKFSVRNSVLVNLLMIGLFVFGFISLNNMPTELNPPISFNWVFVTVPYPGASPTEAENLIVDPIESEIQDIDKISEMQSTAGEGFGMILVKFEDMSDTEFRERYVDLKAEIDKVVFPDEAEDPIVDAFDSNDFMPIITVNMAYDIPEDNAQKIAKEIEEDLLDMKGIAKVQLSGFAEREIWVEVDPEKINSLGVTFEEILMAVKARNLNVPGGNITFGKSEYLIRSVGEYNSVEEVENTIIRSLRNNSGSFIKVKDVAQVKDRREELNILSRLNGYESITFSVSKQAEANSIDVIEEVKTLVEKYKGTVQDGVEFSFSNDNSVYILRVINVLRNNAVSGMILIALVLYFFLGKSNALLASLGIPISFFITFILMDFWGYSLNGSTLFALVMVLGIIVDDAIIVIENCHRYRLMGYNSHDAAIMGTHEVVKPIISSIGTNIAAFLPLMLLPGIMGKFMRIIPLVFSLALLASMFEAFFLLPSHYADWTTKSKSHLKGEKKFFKVLRRKYEILLVKVIRKRYALTTGLVILLFASLSLIPVIGVEMFGEEEFDQFSVLLKYPEGTSLEENNRITQKFESAAMTLSKEGLKDVITNIGLLQSNNEWLEKKNVAQIIVQCHPSEEREITVNELIEELRGKTQTISGPISVAYEKLAGGPPTGAPISVKVQGKYLEDIKKASLALQDSLKLMAGALDIADDFPPGKQEIRILVEEDKASMYGFNTQYVAMNVRYAFDGVEATEFRDGDEEIDLIVKYNLENRSSVDDVLNLKLTSMSGSTVSLRDIVEFEITPGPTEIKRWDQKRTILVTGDINEDVTSLDKINLALEEMFVELEKEHPGVTFKIGGQFEEFMNMFQDITALFILSLILIFIILGTQFNSYLQPIIILTTIPFALIGAMLGLIVSGNPFSIISMFGFVALAGIVVNDAIVMISFINDRRNGENLSQFRYWRSIINAGRLRLRPIILTSLTTIFGLFPMAMGIGGISKMWSPLANVILFGLLVSTILTLFVIPCFCAIVDDIKGKRKNAPVL
ncbi:MAG: efflux RND transporter permease subunit [Melioribacteraceae bacterium]|nr:efflux RND transporter permease subunit [Melioribacteraceae bacterium]